MAKIDRCSSAGLRQRDCPVPGRAYSNSSLSNFTNCIKNYVHYVDLCPRTNYYTTISVDIFTHTQVTMLVAWLSGGDPITNDSKRSGFHV